MPGLEHDEQRPTDSTIDRLGDPRGNTTLPTKCETLSDTINLSLPDHFAPDDMTFKVDHVENDKAEKNEPLSLHCTN